MFPLLEINSVFINGEISNWLFEDSDIGETLEKIIKIIVWSENYHKENKVKNKKFFKIIGEMFHMH